MSSFQAQFERSGPATPPSTVAVVPVDAKAALRRFTEGGAPVDTMSGKEMFAIIEMLKTEYGGGLEDSLLRVKRQLDKKMALLAWVNDNVCPVGKKEAPLSDRTNTAPQAERSRPTTAPPAAEKRQPNPLAAAEPAVAAAAPRAADETAIFELMNGFAEGGCSHTRALASSLGLILPFPT